MARYLKFTLFFVLWAVSSFAAADNGTLAPVDPRALVQQQRLALANGKSGDYFGYAVAFNSTGTVAIIGEPDDSSQGAYDGEAGFAHLYTRSGSSWTLSAILKGSGDSDTFGYAVALNDAGTVALVGAPQDKKDNLPSGAAYVFVKGTGGWTLNKKLVASDLAATDWFGAAVALSADGNTALVGAHAEDAKGTNSGSAYVFVRGTNGWSQQKKLIPSDGASQDRFGEEVVLSANGSTALIGAAGNDDKGANSGSAYVFVRSGTSWSQQKKFIPGDGRGGDLFGVSVAISSDGITALIGASGADPKGSGSGAAYVFKRGSSGWSQQKKLVPSNGTAGDAFGRDVALNGTGTLALIGAFTDDTSAGVDSGAAYLFSRGTSDWTLKQTLLPGTGDILASVTSVSRDGKYAALGAPFGSNYQGAAYIFLNQ
jgi:hypothetical protein